MKNINSFVADKYKKLESGYVEVEDAIYKKNEIGNLYVMSLSFEQELVLNEGVDASDISQYPLEDILDRYNCYISDFFAELNKQGSETCYLEFASSNLDDLRNLRTIIGKHVYNKDIERDGQVFAELIVE